MARSRKAPAAVQALRKEVIAALTNPAIKIQIANEDAIASRAAEVISEELLASVVNPDSIRRIAQSAARMALRRAEEHSQLGTLTELVALFAKRGRTYSKASLNIQISRWGIQPVKPGSKGRGKAARFNIIQVLSRAGVL